MTKFIKSLGAYFFGNILSKIVIFFMLPIYTALVSPEDFGYYDVSLTYLEILTGIVFVNLQLGILRFMYDKKSRNDKYETVNNAIPIYGISIIVYSIILMLINYIFDIKYLAFIALYGIFFTLEKCVGYIARGLGYSTLFAFTGVIATIVIVTVNTIGLLYFHLDYWVLYVAFILGSLVQITIIVIKTRLYSHVSFKKINYDESLSILKFSIPMAINSVVYWFLSGFNRIIISNQLGTEANGYYAIAMKFGVVVSLIGTVFGWALQEVSFDVEANKSKEERNKFYSYLIVKYLQMLLLGISGIILIVSIIFPIMIHETYDITYDLVPLYMVASMLNTFSTFYTNIFAAIKKTNVVFYATVISSLVNILIIMSVINILGIQASNVSLIFSYSIDILLKHYILQKNINLNINFKRVLPLFFVVLISIYGYFNFSIHLIIIGLFLLVILFILIFREEVLNTLKLIKFRNLDN